MTTCTECIESLLTDPRVGYYENITHWICGKQYTNREYIQPLCHGCADSDNGKPQLENIEARVVELENAQPTRWSRGQYGEVQQLRGAVQQLRGQGIYLQKQIKDMAIAKKKEESPQDLSKLYTSDF